MEKEGGVWEQILISCPSSPPPLLHPFILPFPSHITLLISLILEQRKIGEEGRGKSQNHTHHPHTTSIYVLLLLILNTLFCLGDIEGVEPTKSKRGEVGDLEEQELEAPIGEIEAQSSKVTSKPIQFEIVKWMRMKCVLGV